MKLLSCLYFGLQQQSVVGSIHQTAERNHRGPSRPAFKRFSFGVSPSLVWEVTETVRYHNFYSWRDGCCSSSCVPSFLSPLRGSRRWTRSDFPAVVAMEIFWPACQRFACSVGLCAWTQTHKRVVLLSRDDGARLSPCSASTPSPRLCASTSRLRHHGNPSTAAGCCEHDTLQHCPFWRKGRSPFPIIYMALIQK